MFLNTPLIEMSRIKNPCAISILAPPHPFGKKYETLVPTIQISSAKDIAQGLSTLKA